MRALDWQVGNRSYLSLNPPVTALPPFPLLLIPYYPLIRFLLHSPFLPNAFISITLTYHPFPPYSSPFFPPLLAARISLRFE